MAEAVIGLNPHWVCAATSGLLLNFEGLFELSPGTFPG